MSTSILPPPSDVTAPRAGLILTSADVARLPRSLATTEVRYELHHGRLTVMAPPGDIHGQRQARFAAYLFLHGEQPGHGQARAEVGILLRRNPDHLLGPDAAFLTAAQLPPRLSPEGYLLTIPQLVVEVRSKNDTQPEIDEKVRDFLTAGVILVWVADPDTQTVTAYRINQAPVCLYCYRHPHRGTRHSWLRGFGHGPAAGLITSVPVLAHIQAACDNPPAPGVLRALSLCIPLCIRWRPESWVSWSAPSFWSPAWEP